MMAHDFQAHCQQTTFSASRIIAKNFFTVSRPVWIITELQWRAEKYMQKRVFIPYTFHVGSKALKHPQIDN